MKTIFMTLAILLILPSCNKPKKADNAVTQHHKKQIDKVKAAKANVKGLNNQMKTQSQKAQKIKNE